MAGHSPGHLVSIRKIGTADNVPTRINARNGRKEDTTMAKNRKAPAISVELVPFQPSAEVTALALSGRAMRNTDSISNV